MTLVNKITWCHGVDETLSTKLLNCSDELQILTKVIINTDFGI